MHTKKYMQTLNKGPTLTLSKKFNQPLNHKTLKTLQTLHKHNGYILNLKKS